MNVAPQHLAALQDLGYTHAESTFLYLVATHSGYFTRRQFLDFTNHDNSGKYVHSFTRKTLVRRHARATEYGRQTLIYNLYSRLVYGAIDKDNLRNRRRQSKELTCTRLYILDFVLNHPDHHYFETEADKVRYFHEQLRLPLALLPGRIYKGIRSASHTKRYFVDRFPIFLPNGNHSLALPPAVTFAYLDSPAPSLAGCITHLRAYEPFLRRLPAFNFIYAAPTPTKFERARAFFTRLFRDRGWVNARHLLRYFQVRSLWDSKKYTSLTRADRDLLRDGDRRYHGEPYESAYQKWAAGRLRENDLDAFLGRPQERPERNFYTYVLPRHYELFFIETDHPR